MQCPQPSAAWRRSPFQEKMNMRFCMPVRVWFFPVPVPVPAISRKHFLLLTEEAVECWGLAYRIRPRLREEIWVSNSASFCSKDRLGLQCEKYKQAEGRSGYIQIKGLRSAHDFLCVKSQTRTFYMISEYGLANTRSPWHRSRSFPSYTLFKTW